MEKIYYCIKIGVNEEELIILLRVNGIMILDNSYPARKNIIWVLHLNH